MKKTAILFLSVLLFSVSCSKDDDGQATEQESAALVGTWDMKKNESENMEITSAVQGGEISFSQNYYSEKMDYQVIFNENQTVTSGGSFDQVTTTTFAGQASTSTFKVDTGTDGKGFFSGNYDQKDGHLVIVDARGETTTNAKIISLEGNTMILQLDLSQATDLYELGDNVTQIGSGVTVTGTATVELEKRKL